MSERTKPFGVFFATNDCPAAKWKRRSRVMKANSEPGDSHPNGTLGQVIGSIGHPTLGVAYFVEWDTERGVHVLLAEKNLAEPASRPPKVVKVTKVAKASSRTKNGLGGT